MNPKIIKLFLAVCFAFPCNLLAQAVVAVDDTLTVIQGQPIQYNVTDNDIVNPAAPNPGPVFWIQPASPCINLEDSGALSFPPDTTCIGQMLEYTYRYESCASCSARVSIQIKGPQPDCYFINMGDFSGNFNPDSKRCAEVCENSASACFTTYNPGSTYVWSVIGGAFSPGINPATINIYWGAQGAGTISVAVTTGGVTTTNVACVNILEGPTASFSTTSTSICKNASVTFTNTTAGVSNCFWDFGDGSSASGSSVTHTYSTPGTHTACLIVSRENFDSNGTQLCNCSDTVCVDILVDPLSGPNIYCVSTLCAQDSSKYWTDALCDSLTWTVLGPDSLPVVFTGQGQDTISVQWGDGPSGTVSLSVKDCIGAYCDGPVSVNIPIIPATTTITGATEVCRGDVETYTVPKWMGVKYEWQVSGAQSVVNHGNTILVLWGQAGVGSVMVHYFSDFLSGLPGHDSTDCMGTATLNVRIKAPFKVSGPFKPVVCAQSTSTYNATPTGAYHWTITGGNASPLIQGDGTSFITVTWNSGPGDFAITTTPVDPSLYCNDLITNLMQVIEVPLPSGIEGPDTICPGATHTYYAQTNQTGVGFNWSATNGTITVNAGASVTVDWNNTGPYALQLQQFLLDGSMCLSDTATFPIHPKAIQPFNISGSTSLCINALEPYTVAPIQQDPDATYSWTVLDSLMGSVANGQGTPDIHVQWNNLPDTAALILTVTLCDSTLSDTIQIILNAPIDPIITQKDTVCKDQVFQLEVNNGCGNYTWSTGATTQSILASSNTLYTVKTCDTNGCVVYGAFHTDSASIYPLPPSHQPDLIWICIQPCDSLDVTIQAPNGPGPYTYTWTCDGILQPNISDHFIHKQTCVNDTFLYTVTLTNMYGCTSISETEVIQSEICVTGDCVPDTNAMLSFSFSQPAPDCNVVNFAALYSHADLLDWNFGDNSINTYTGTLDSPSHVYTEVGCFEVVLRAKVANNGTPPPDTCIIFVKDTVCIPLVAQFNCVVNCSTVTFMDTSLYYPSANAPTSWFWTFGDTMSPSPEGTSMLPNPTYTYAQPGIYTVTLTIMNNDSCKSTFSKEIVIRSVFLDSIQVMKDTICVGTPLQFSSETSGNPVVQWDWDFGDGSTNGSAQPFHSFLSPGIYTVGLTVTDVEGCTDTDSIKVVAVALAPYQDIHFDPSLSVCDSTEVTLTAPMDSSYQYLWSNGSITHTIKTDSAGTYSVTITNAFGCTMTPKPVEIVVYPSPQIAIAGNPYICNRLSTTLSLPIGQHYTYQWFPNGETTNSITTSTEGTYSVIVIDTSTHLKCSTISETVNVVKPPLPSLDISSSAGHCEGMPNQLVINNLSANPNLTYAWSTGATDQSITVSQAGTYYAVGTDSQTGCFTETEIIIDPLPDLCFVPTGCYQTCDPVTICGPNLSTYQWNKNDSIFPGQTNQCLTVTQSGTYSLTGTTAKNCTLSSEPLMLSVIDCSCLPLQTLNLICPSNITVDIPVGQNFAEVQYALPTATSTCPSGASPPVLMNGLASGPFPVGTTEVCYQTEDSCCNKIKRCFTVTVNSETPCDEETTACTKFELLSIVKDAAGNQTYRMRITNHCAEKLIYAAFQVPNGIAGILPSDNSIYTAPSSRTYNVRNPNFSPYYSIRFKSILNGISNGQSDIFEYTLPPQVCQGCILATVKLAPQIYYEAHLCCVMPSSMAVSPSNEILSDALKSETNDRSMFDSEPTFSLYPNPTDGALFADLSNWEGSLIQLQIRNTQGQLLQDQTLRASDAPQAILLPQGLQDGLYFIEVVPENSPRQVARFVLIR